MSKDTEKAEQVQADDQQHPAVSVFTYVLGGAIGLLILVGLAAVLEGGDPAKGAVEELPHLAVLVSFDDFRSPNTRSALAEMQRELADTGLAVLGPLNFPILIPGDNFGDAPTAKSLDVITEPELARADPYFESGKWLVPRIYSADLREAIIRIAPPGRGQFPSGSKLKVEQVIEKYRGQFSQVLLYSRALGLEDEEARNRINLTFGVQSANVLVISQTEGLLGEPAIVSQLFDVAKSVADPAVRSSVSVGNYVAYAFSVRKQTMDSGVNNAPVKEILAQARGWNVPLLLGNNGQEAWVEVYTEAEGKANAELCYYLASNYPKIDGIAYKVLRKRQVKVE